MKNLDAAYLNGEFEPIQDTANGRKVYKQSYGNFYLYSTVSRWIMSQDYKGDSLNARINVSIPYHK